MRARYKTKLSKIESSTYPLKDFTCSVAIDCSCEIWMVLVRYKIFPHIVTHIITDLEEGLTILYRDIVNRCCQKLKSYYDPLCLISPDTVEYIFDHPHHTNSYKSHEMVSRSCDLNDAIKNFELAYTFHPSDTPFLISCLNNIIKCDTRRISHMVYNKMQRLDYVCIQSPSQYFYDADVYCGKRYKIVVSHDLDVLLFGSLVIIKNINHDTMDVVTYEDFMYRASVTTMDALRNLCILLGTDYNDDEKPHFINRVKDIDIV